MSKLAAQPDSREKIKVEIIKDLACKEQIKKLYIEAGWWNDDDNADPDLINKIFKGSYCFAAATADNRLIGMGRVISDGASDSYIQDVFVTKKYRKKGIGILIMDELIKYLKNNKINWITLISEPDAEEFYKKYGFSQMKDYIPFILK